MAAPGLRNCFLLSRPTRSACFHFRSVSLASNHHAGQKFRVSQGKAPDALSYGPLTDLPDWSFADGQSAPETKRRQLRLRRRLDVAARINKLLTEVDEAKEKSKGQS
ncbi:39S ribosomal protein L52, mitochondrial [Nematostella vectensis]|uniref:39S ribosomal protein L52, mitochondrial n=1 Tax=Nematostella vectensis TaxID=45351 RepID=UPI0020770837|nr:39S ribosomal protein L52, mitochondrial [Nematostella vectensis]